MDETTNLLLQRVAVLRNQLREQNQQPAPETISAIVAELEKTVERAHAELAALRRDHAALNRRNREISDLNDSLSRQKEGLERQLQGLERQVKTLERHNTNLLRQNGQLERHNAALEESRQAIEAEKRRYQNLFEYSPDAFLITDNNGVILEANQAAAAMLNASKRDLRGDGLERFVAEHHKKLFVTLLTRLQRIQDVEVCFQPPGRPPLDASLTLSTLYDDHGTPVMLHWMLRDITERRRTMAALNASERRFRTIFNEAMLGILLIDRDLKVARANRAFQEMLGYHEDELNGRPVTEFTCPEDAPIGNTWLMLQENRSAVAAHVVEIRFRRRDRQYVWCNVSLSALRGEGGQPLYLLAMIKDITGERQASAELAELRRRLVESGEVERLRLAQELHDGPTQDLYAAAFRAANFSDQSGDPDTQQNLHELERMLKNIANNLRDIVGELRPPTIGNLGLECAIRSHAERVQEEYPGLEIKLHLSPDGKTLPNHTRLALFRIYQQCMTNILRHSEASQAVIAFHLNNEEITLDIWDNGRGFNPPARWVDLMRDGHYGLAGIAERVQALGGVMNIESRRGAGTLVHVTAPREQQG